MEKENYIYLRRRKRRKIFAEGKYIFLRRRRKKKKYLQRENIFVLRRKSKKKKYLEKDNIFFCGEKKRRRKRKKICGEGKCHDSGSKKRKEATRPMDHGRKAELSNSVFGQRNTCFFCKKKRKKEEEEKK